MDQYNQQSFTEYTLESESVQKSAATQKTFVASVFSWMFLALAISALCAYAFATNEQLLGYLLNFETGGLSTLGYVVMFAPIGFVLAMSVGFARFSATVLIALFVIYAAITGI